MDDELARLRAEVERLRAALKALVKDEDAGHFRDGDEGIEWEGCWYCETEWYPLAFGKGERYGHTADCPIMRGRALVGDDGAREEA